MCTCLLLFLLLLRCNVLFMFIVPNQINDRRNEEAWIKKTWALRSYMWSNGRKLSISNEISSQASGASTFVMSLPCRHSTLPHYSHHCFTTQRTHNAYRHTHTQLSYLPTYSTATTYWHQLLLAARSVCAGFFSLISHSSFLSMHTSSMST